MNSIQLKFALFNICFPLLLGCFFYSATNYFPSGTFIRNYLPDGLWAYAFCSSLLLIWDRKINWRWFTILILVFVSFEILQKMEWINGTADITDLIVYIAFTCLALIANNLFLKK